MDHLTDVRPEQCGQWGALLVGEDTEPERHQVTDFPRITPVATEYWRHCLWGWWGDLGPASAQGMESAVCSRTLSWDWSELVVAVPRGRNPRAFSYLVCGVVGPVLLAVCQCDRWLYDSRVGVQSAYGGIDLRSDQHSWVALPGSSAR